MTAPTGGSSASLDGAQAKTSGAKRPSGRLLFVSSFGGDGGAERCMLRLIVALAERGWEPFLACPGDSHLERAGRKAGVAVEPIVAPAFFDEAVGVPGRGLDYLSRRVRTWANYARAVGAAGRIASIVRSRDIDIVHSNSPRAAVMGGLAARAAGRPSVTHVRDIVHTPFAYRARRVLLNGVTDIYVCASKATAAIVRTSRPIVIAYDGISPDLVSSLAKDERPRNEVGMAAILTPWKGHETFVRAAIDLATKYPDFEFTVVGGDLGLPGLQAFRERLEALISAANLRDRIRFLGHRNDVERWMSRLKVFVHPPIAPDPFPGVVLEACAAGCSIVATNVGGIPEIVTNEESALLISPGDYRGLAAAMHRVLTDESLATRLRLNARRVVERFPMSDTVASVESAYATVWA